MATEIIDEAGNGEHTKIPPEDRDPEIVKAAARTAFLNFCKRYLAENDPQKALKKDRYIKNRRRWARKDLKQKKRSKAALDPSFSPSLPPTALHLDYMSSEYSSAGENSADEGDEALDVKSVRSQRWAEMLAVKASEPSLIEGKGGWAEGLGEKVLEVRTPRWRSSALNDMYKRLDAISAFSSSRTPPADPSLKGGTRAGHVAPSHRRFVLEDRYARKGKAPRELGEDWMWKSGRVGAWSDGDRSTDAMQRPVGTAEGEGDGVSILFGEEDWREDETGALVNALQGIPE